MSKKKVNSKDANNEPQIYCGPSLKNMQSFSTYTGVLPEHVQNHLENPLVRALFVPVSLLGEIRKAIATEGTKENSFYQKILEQEGGQA